MFYSIQFTRRAQRDFDALDKPVQQRLRIRIDGLASNPFPTGAKRLHGDEPFYRIRVGDYRVVYEVDGKQLIVVVVKVGHRKEIYR
jgi:mRNA interferase RelE/StbE